MTIREGCWDCPSCGSKRQLGRHVYCTGCGAPRPQEIRFYLPEDAAVVTDPTLLAQANAGADWICGHCGGSARATDTSCPGCGSPREADDQARQEHVYGLADIPRSGEDPPPAAAPQGLVTPPAAAKSKRSGCGCLTLLLVVMGWCGWSNRTRHVEGALLAKHWERSVQVEAYRTVSEDGWSLPAGGREIRSFRAIREYRQVLDHYESKTRQVSEQVQTGTRTYSCGQIDRGNGYFEERTCTEPEYETRYHTESYEDPVYRQEPVWDTKYEYDIERWVPDQLLALSGDTTPPAWPVTVPDDTTREGEKKQRYVLTFLGEKQDTLVAEVPLEQFTHHRVGERVPLLLRGRRVQIDTARDH
jgi:hypothetical protein